MEKRKQIPAHNNFIINIANKPLDSVQDPQTQLQCGHWSPQQWQFEALGLRSLRRCLTALSLPKDGDISTLAARLLSSRPGREAARQACASTAILALSYRLNLLLREKLPRSEMVTTAGLAPAAMNLPPFVSQHRDLHGQPFYWHNAEGALDPLHQLRIVSWANIL